MKSVFAMVISIFGPREEKACDSGISEVRNVSVDTAGKIREACVGDGDDVVLGTGDGKTDGVESAEGSCPSIIGGRGVCAGELDKLKSGDADVPGRSVVPESSSAVGYNGFMQRGSRPTAL